MTIKQQILKALNGALEEFSYNPPKEVYSECQMLWDIDLILKDGTELGGDSFVADCQSAICDLESIIMSDDAALWPDVTNEIKDCFNCLFEDETYTKFLDDSAENVDLTRSKFFVRIFEVVDNGADVWKYHMMPYSFAECLGENND